MMRDFLVEVMLPMAFILVVVISVIDRVMWRSCNEYQDQTGRETQYRILQDCYVKTGSGWLTRDEYRASITAREGLEGGNDE